MLWLDCSDATALYLECCASQIGLYFRFTHRFGFDLPFVLGPEPRQANIVATGSVLLQACRDLAKYSNTSGFSYRRVPGFHTSIGVLALGTLLQTAHHTTTDVTDATDRITSELLASACQDLSSVHPMLASVISRLRKPLAVTQAVREFAQGDLQSLQIQQQNAEDQSLYDALGMGLIADGMDMFTDWIWPADEDWLSGLLSLDPSAVA